MITYILFYDKQLHICKLHNPFNESFGQYIYSIKSCSSDFTLVVNNNCRE